MRATGETGPVSAAADADVRRLYRGLVELSVAAPVGDLLDIGCGQGRVLKLLAPRAHRAVGVDIDADARQFARAELLIAGVENASLRQGTMYELPFGDQEFDTVVLDDVLCDADEPLAAVREAGRLLKPGGRLLLLAAVDGESAGNTASRFADWCRSAGLRIALPRRIPRQDPHWLLAVATPAGAAAAAA
jgi:SAM-dependent methyltransferase